MSEDKSVPAEGFISANKEIDVDAIMASIKERIEEKKRSGVLKQGEIDEIMDMELLPLPDFLDIPNVYQPHLYPPHPVEEFRAFHIEPEIEAGLAKKVLGKIRRLFLPLLRFMLRPFLTEQKNLFVELHNRNKEDIYNIKQSVPLIQQSKEYIKLLHNALNNMIVEFSKQKVEEEMLKTRIKVLEDKIEFLENRERAIEKKVFAAPEAS